MFLELFRVRSFFWRYLYSYNFCLHLVRSMFQFRVEYALKPHFKDIFSSWFMSEILCYSIKYMETSYYHQVYRWQFRFHKLAPFYNIISWHQRCRWKQSVSVNHLMSRPALQIVLCWLFFEGANGEARGHEFKKERGEQELVYDETLDHYVIQIEENQVWKHWNFSSNYIFRN